MFCVLLLIVHTWALAVEGGANSASAEAPAKAGANNNGAAAGNNGAPNGAQANAKPLLANLVQIGGYIFLQPVANQAGQASLQPLIPIGVAPQTAAFIVGQQGGADLGPLGQVTLGAGAGGPVTLLAVLPQVNGGAANKHQLLSTLGTNGQQQAAVALGAVPARLRARRSLAARLLGTQAPATAGAAATTTADEEEEDWSGMEEEEEEGELEK